MTMPFDPLMLTKQMDITHVRAPWAPGLIMAFGRWRGDLPAIFDLATGKGRTDEQALVGCLGEMIENLSIGVAAHPDPVLARFEHADWPAVDARVIDLALPGDLGSEGCAAHPNADRARLAAACERIERASLALWWAGKLEAKAIDLPEQMLKVWRQGARHRRTRAWRLDAVLGIATILVLTDDGAGQTIALGTAAALSVNKALDGALREAMLAEIAFVAPPAHPDHSRAHHTSDRLAPRLRTLAAAPVADDRLSQEDTLDTLMACVNAADIPLAFADLTHPALGYPVMRCVCPSLPLARGLGL